jgi:O-antigen/teichoic acid export membrane protein
MHYLAADSLTGAGYQGTRTALQIFIAVVNVALNFAMLPRYSWRGAVWTSLGCDGALALLLWIAVWILCARERQAATSGQLESNAAAQA